MLDEYKCPHCNKTHPQCYPKPADLEEELKNWPIWRINVVQRLLKSQAEQVRREERERIGQIIFELWSPENNFENFKEIRAKIMEGGEAE
jgi:hypothetical protein